MTDHSRASRSLGWNVLKVGVRPHRRTAILGLTAGFLWSASKLAVPALIAYTIDTAVTEGRTSAVLVDSAVICAVGAFGACAAALRRWWAQRLGYLVERDI